MKLEAGELICQKRSFGSSNRYAIAPVYTRFNTVQWFVWDAETRNDLDDKATIIRQADTIEEALKDLPALDDLILD
jgi:hypothetical protein